MMDLKDTMLNQYPNLLDGYTRSKRKEVDLFYFRINNNNIFAEKIRCVKLGKNEKSKKESTSFFRGIIELIARILTDFWEWLKPNPVDHWSLQVIKGIGKFPLVLLLIICSPVLLVILLVVFLIAI